MRAAQAVRAAEQRGEKAGRSSGTWVFDGNTDTATYQRVLEGYNEGDPEIMDMQPSPLSGEWASESIDELLGDLLQGRRHWTQDHIMDAYEEGFQRGFWAEVVRAANYQLCP